MNKKFYITAAIPYVNAKPHIGHALELVQADVVARYHKLLGEEVLLLSGGDENALKNVQAAEKAGRPVQEFIDENNQKFVELTHKLGCAYDIWQKGSDKKDHFPSSQKLWRLCEKDIYKKKYKGLYCVGCEIFYEKEELNENGECFEHPGKKLDEVGEENYFFRLSKYQNELVELIESNKFEVVPQERKNEVLAFLKSGLQDISISRSNERAKNWGVPVPGDDTQRIYVWFDALNVYQSGIGFGWDEEKYNKWWPADVHVIGKGIIRFHAVYWPAFLLSAGLKLPKKIFVHGYYTVNGQKMSKTVGNVYDPVPLLEKYGADPLRYYCLAKTPPFTDGDFSEEKFVEAYNADLANGLGNTVSRVIGLIERYSDGKIPEIEEAADTHPLRVGEKIHNWKKVWKDIDEFTLTFQFDQALGSVWKYLKEADKYIEENKPWDLVKTSKKKLNWVLYGLIDGLHQVAWQIYPFLPETARKIGEILRSEKLLVKIPNYKDSWVNLPSGREVEIKETLFPRIQ
ncbi:MAG: methionine--tRNA ligase [Patescibacteria group bacterium]